MKEYPIICCAHSLAPSPFFHSMDCALTVEKACTVKESALCRLPSSAAETGGCTRQLRGGAGQKTKVPLRELDDVLIIEFYLLWTCENSLNQLFYAWSLRSCSATTLHFCLWVAWNQGDPNVGYIKFCISSSALKNPTMRHPKMDIHIYWIFLSLIALFFCCSSAAWGQPTLCLHRNAANIN